jgi:fumarate reductase flavoprotein subunit
MLGGVRAVKVTGALFHTQGGLAIDASARVRKNSGGAFTNLFAVGGAAAGVSGSSANGYLSGNGLLKATVFGRLAGNTAARGSIGWRQAHLAQRPQINVSE